MQAKIGSGETSFAGSLAGYDEYVPMVDKAVDATWKVKPTTTINRVQSKGNFLMIKLKKGSNFGIKHWTKSETLVYNLFFFFAGVLVTPNVPKENESFSARVLVFFMAIVMAILAFFRTVSNRVVTKQLPPPPPQIEGNAAAREEEAELLNSVLKKLTELEEKIGALQSKPNEMPYEKEELLNAAVCRVDALEAELIATKKVNLNTPYVQT